MGKYNAIEEAGACKDLRRDCPTRAAAGECDSKAEEMLGPGGACRRACKDCVMCPRGDVICLRRNMNSLRKTLLRGDEAP